MRRFFVILFICLSGLSGLPAAVSAQQSQWRQADDDYRERKDLLRVGISAISSNGLGAGFIPVTIAYDRYVRHNVTIGGVIHSSNHFFSFSTDGYTVEDVSIFAGARAGYDLKVARNLRLRFGLGAGLGCHIVLNIEAGRGATLPDSVNFPADRWLPHLLADIHWAWRVGRNLELTFAPLVVSPSQLIFSPWDDDYYSGGYYNFNCAPVGLSVRF
jgi:hypothetical protein